MAKYNLKEFEKIFKIKSPTLFEEYEKRMQGESFEESEFNNFIEAVKKGEDKSWTNYWEKEEQEILLNWIAEVDNRERERERERESKIWNLCPY
ncbi:MAG: hypothetical protein I3273_06185 [Candidatus Moeniiplasma glomeromycotorum]|nr:hypothetical protein [Candidatus Moeniiplasma glomeromycotorum]MCE8169673.1 hypothetical protein [Candidatus Moeniiplasma glomeromycotorum]